MHAVATLMKSFFKTSQLTAYKFFAKKKTQPNLL